MKSSLAFKVISTSIFVYFQKGFTMKLWQNTQFTTAILFCCIERFSLDCRNGIGFGFGFGFTTPFGWLVYLLWFWFYDSQVKTALFTA